MADRVSGTCYRLDLTPKKWDPARDACAANGETLVVLEPAVKAEFIRDVVVANRGELGWARNLLAIVCQKSI